MAIAKVGYRIINKCFGNVVHFLRSWHPPSHENADILHIAKPSMFKSLCSGSFEKFEAAWIFNTFIQDGASRNRVNWAKDLAADCTQCFG